MEPRSGCPINAAVEVLGDRWSLLVLRDVIFGDRRYFRALLTGSIEGIASNILADRLVRLVEAGILTRGNAARGQRARYSLTEAGIRTLPVIYALGNWGLDWRSGPPELRRRQELMRAEGPAFIEELMDELRVRHLDAPPKPRPGPGAFERLDGAGRDRAEALFLGGRSGVGKSSVGYEIHARLSAADVRHCLIEGDNLDMAHPPGEHGLAERNLATMWANYRALGHRRLIYTNTASVRVVSELTAAMGDDPLVTAVLLTADDTTARQRLARREIGTALDQHIERSDRAARELEQLSPSWVHRVPTDGRPVADIAAQIIALTGWTGV